MYKILHWLRAVALAVRVFVFALVRGWEPVMARQIASVVFVLCGQLGIAVGDLPAQVEAIIVAVTLLIPLLLAWRARSKVIPVTKLESTPPPEIEG